MTNMFAAAVGLAPFKDNFWTTETQPGNVYSMYTCRGIHMNDVGLIV